MTNVIDMAHWAAVRANHPQLVLLHDDSWPCDTEPRENNLRPDGTLIVPTAVLETRGKDPA